LTTCCLQLGTTSGHAQTTSVPTPTLNCASLQLDGTDLLNKPWDATIPGEAHKHLWVRYFLQMLYYHFPFQLILTTIALKLLFDTQCAHIQIEIFFKT